MQFASVKVKSCPENSPSEAYGKYRASCETPNQSENHNAIDFCDKWERNEVHQSLWKIARDSQGALGI